MCTMVGDIDFAYLSSGHKVSHERNSSSIFDEEHWSSKPLSNMVSNVPKSILRKSYSLS